MVTAPAVVERVVRVPKLSALRIGKRPHEKISSYHSEKTMNAEHAESADISYANACSASSASSALDVVKKGRNDLWNILVFDVRGVVHAPHVGRTDAAAKAFERGADLRVLQQRLCPRDRCRVVRREVMPVVIELHEIQGGDEPRRRVAGDKIHLARRQRAIAEREIHD